MDMFDQTEPYREFPLMNGNTLKATMKDPFGFWQLSLKQGAMPSKFQGMYTSLEEAKKAIAIYLAERNLEIGEPPPRPEIKFKKVRKPEGLEPKETVV